MNLNPPVKRYGRKDIGIMIPNTEFCPTEFPRLHAQPAPYLNLKLYEEKHGEYYVLLSGKVVAQDSNGFLVPAGLLVQMDTYVAAVTAAKGATLDATAVANVERYDATDVAQGVVNSRGNACKLGEPIVHSMIKVGGAFLAAYDAAAAVGFNTAIPVANAAVTRFVSIGNHIGLAFESWLRPNSDVMSRAANDHLFNTDAAVGMEALKGRVNAVDERTEAWNLSNQLHTVKTNYCWIYPVVTAAAPLIEGQAVAVAASMAALPLGARVTYDKNSDIVLHSLTLDEVTLAASMDGAGAATDAAAIAVAVAEGVEKYHARCVGQIIKKDTRHPKSLLDKVKTRWDTSITGFETLDRMPGSANGAYPWNMQTAASTLGEVVISTFHR